MRLVKQHIANLNHIKSNQSRTETIIDNNTDMDTKYSTADTAHIYSTADTQRALQRANDDGHGTSLQYKIIVDSGCTYFVTPHKHYFLPNSLIPTTQTMVGVEGKPTPLLGEGIISITR